MLQFNCKYKTKMIRTSYLSASFVLLILIFFILNCGETVSYVKESINKNGGPISLRAYFPRKENQLYMYQTDHLFLVGTKERFDVKIDFEDDNIIHALPVISIHNNSEGKRQTDATVKFTFAGILISIVDIYGNIIMRKEFEAPTFSSTGSCTVSDAIIAKPWAKNRAIENGITIIRRQLEPQILNWIINSNELKQYASQIHARSIAVHGNPKRTDIKTSQTMKQSRTDVDSSKIDSNWFIWDPLAARERPTSPQNRRLSSSPFELINQYMQAKIDDFLKPRKPIDISSKIPSEISKPELPPAPDLVKNQFETKEQYFSRVKKAQDDRQLLVEKMQYDYRQNVEARNHEMDALKKAYEMDIEAIRQEQTAKKLQLSEKVNEYAKEAFFDIMGKPELDTSAYDAETQKMYAFLKAGNANYQKKISFSVPSEEAKQMYYQLKNNLPVVYFSIHDNEIKLEQIKVTYEGKVYPATIDEKDFTPEQLQIALKDTKVNVDSVTQNKLTLQNPNLHDSYMIQAIAYGENAKTRGLNYNDDLKPILANLKQAQEDSKKWLFIIAIENYDATDPVVFAKNSAEEFKIVAQKVFGISEKHIHSLIEEKATSGAIKDNLELLISRDVKEGDLIYFYYSGHGVPDPTSSESYILPKDKVVDFINREPDFSLTNIYKKLTDSKATKVVAFIDACFSGKTDNISLFKGTAPGLIRSKEVQFDNTKMLLFSAGKNTQFSNSYNEKGHRMFSYFLIKSLITQSRLTPEVLYSEVNKQVHDNSLAKGDLDLQEPQIYGNIQLGLY